MYGSRDRKREAKRLAYLRQQPIECRQCHRDRPSSEIEMCNGKPMCAACCEQFATQERLEREATEERGSDYSWMEP
jgi:formylmethanofuran dehydrogenase subunit E